MFGILLVSRIWLLVSCPEEFIISDEGSVGLLYAWPRGVRLVSLSGLYSPFMGGRLVAVVLNRRSVPKEMRAQIRCDLCGDEQHNEESWSKLLELLLTGRG